MAHNFLQSSGYVEEFSNKLSNPNTDDLIYLSLYISGVSEYNIDHYKNKLYFLINNIKTELGDLSTEKEKAEGILEYLHTHQLTLYAVNQSRLDILLDTGAFNCVSSAIIYVLLAEGMGLKTRGVKTKDHAFCRVTAGAEVFDVETTNKFGFDPGSKKAFMDEFGNITGFNYVSPGNYSERNEISPVKLISLIIKNRVSRLAARGYYDEAVGVAYDGWHLFRDREFYDNMVKAFLKRVAIYNRQGEYINGISFLDQAIIQIGADPRMIKSRSDLFHNRIITLTGMGALGNRERYLNKRYKEGFLTDAEYKKYALILILKRVEGEAEESYETALVTIENGLTIFPGEEKLLALKANYIHNRVVESFGKGDFEYSYSLVNKFKASGDLEEGKWREFLLLIFQEKASRLASVDYLKAAGVIMEGVREVGTDPKLIKHYNTYIHNYEVVVHNMMVKHYNAGEYVQALGVIEEGLGNLPESRKFREDLELLEEAL